MEAPLAAAFLMQMLLYVLANLVLVSLGLYLAGLARAANLGEHIRQGLLCII